MKHLELRSSENSLASGRAFKTRMIVLERVFNAKDCFHDLSCLIFDFYWICSINAVDIIILLRSSLFPSLTYTLVLILPRRYLYLSVHCLHNRLNGSSFYFPIRANYCAVSVGHELQHFSKTTAVNFSFRFSSAIVHFVKPNLSSGPQTSAKPVVMSAFDTDAVQLNARNFGANLKV